MGHIITSAGQRADDAKIKAITDMPPPEDKQSLQRLLGMTKFLAQYIPNEALLTALLRQLLKKDAVWQWCPQHSAALETLKTALTQAPVLKKATYFTSRLIKGWTRSMSATRRAASLLCLTCAHRY